MANFIGKAQHPKTGEVQEAFFIGDYFGDGELSIIFPKGDAKLIPLNCFNMDNVDVFQYEK